MSVCLSLCINLAAQYLSVIQRLSFCDEIFMLSEPLVSFWGIFLRIRIYNIIPVCDNQCGYWTECHGGSVQYIYAGHPVYDTHRRHWILKSGILCCEEPNSLCSGKIESAWHFSGGEEDGEPFASFQDFINFHIQTVFLTGSKINSAPPGICVYV